MATRIREIMTKNPEILDVQSTILDAARIMRDKNIGDVLVRDEDGLCGIVTDRDLVVRAVAEGMDPSTTTLDEVCSEEVVQLDPDDTVEDAIRLMREKHVRRIPVTEENEIIGVVSLGDLAIERDRESVLGEISAAPPNQ